MESAVCGRYSASKRTSGACQYLTHNTRGKQRGPVALLFHFPPWEAVHNHSQMAVSC